MSFQGQDMLHIKKDNHGQIAREEQLSIFRRQRPPQIVSPKHDK